jgi:hypothetical protein
VQNFPKRQGEVGKQMTAAHHPLDWHSGYRGIDVRD